MNIKVNIFCFILVAFSVLTSHAQQPFSQHFNLINGLPSNAVYSILEDRDGFIWLTTEEGLFQYDGAKFNSYRTDLQDSYSGSGLVQDPLGRIWYQDFDGNSFYVEKNILKPFKQKSSSTFLPIHFTDKHIFFQEKNTICIADLKSLNVLKRIRVQNFIYAATTIDNNYIYTIENQLYSIDDALNSKKIGETPLGKTGFPILFGDGESFWLTKKSGQSNGIWIWKQNKFQLLVNVDSNVVVQNARVINGSVYLLTTNGTFVLKKGCISLEEFFEARNPSDMIRDRKGNFWISSNISGVHLLPNINVKKHNLNNFQTYRAITVNKKLLLSSKNEQISWFDPRTKELELFASGTNNALPYYLFVDSVRQQVVYVQSDGFSYFSDLKNKKPIQKISLAIKKIIRLDHKYNGVVSTGFYGFYCHKDDLNKKSFYDEYIKKLEQKIIGNYYFFRINIEGRAKSVFLNPQNKKLYFISNNGVFLWEKGQIKKHQFENFVPGVLSLKLWNKQEFALSIAGKLVELKSGRLSQKNKAFDKIQGIKQVITQPKFIYIRSNEKICIFNASENGEVKEYACYNLSGTECTDFAVIDKTVWIVATEGLIAWNFDKEKQKTVPGLFKILTTRINGIEILSLNRGKFKYTENNISIDFALLDFGLPTISGLQYKINNQPWEATDVRIRTLNFPSLSAGNYNIKIRGKVDGKWVDFETLKFQIQQPFWSTVWFYILTTFLITALLIGYYNSRLRVNRVKNELVNEKIVLESNLNKSLLASIKSQMNPHFIFNALNTIQAYIYVNDKKNATNYLSKFSKLTRSVLEMSEKDEVYLSEELNSLTLYLDLEKMRFQDGFDYRFVLNETNVDQIKIPSMLLQPYVENAIKHGLLHSTNHKNLVVEFQEEKNVLTVLIDDNGIGRKKAEELRQKREEMHESFSSKANEKRIDLLNANKEISVLYTDKHDSDGRPTGTTVTLKIHLKK